MNITKKTIAAVVAGTFIYAGIIAPFAVQAAASEKKERPAIHQRKFDSEKATARLSKQFGIGQNTIKKYQEQGYTFRDIARGAVLAKTSGKPFENVMALKTTDKNWKAITEELGVTPDQIKSVRQEIAIERITEKTKMNNNEVSALVNQGYKGRDIMMAGMVSKKTDRSPSDIIQLKKINNTWLDVAEAVGVDKESFKAELKEMRKHSPHYKGRN